MLIDLYSEEKCKDYLEKELERFCINAEYFMFLLQYMKTYNCEFSENFKELINSLCSYIFMFKSGTEDYGKFFDKGENKFIKKVNERLDVNKIMEDKYYEEHML